MWKSAILAILSGGIVLFAGMATAAERHVPSQYATIQAAINACSSGDTVLVANGVYTGTGNRDIDFLGKAITVKSENGPENCIIDCQGSSGDHHRGFYFQNGEGRNSVLEGFTITGGYVVVMCEAGAGIYIYGASPTIRGCIIINNYAELEMGSLCYCYGGGIYIGWESNPLITDCVISGNSVGNFGEGGGIYCGFNSQMTLSNCLIYNNTAQEYGGAGGGILCDPSGDLTAINCTIAYNSASEEGGGIYGSSLSIRNGIIWANSPDQIHGSADINYSDVQGGGREQVI